MRGTVLYRASSCFCHRKHAVMNLFLKDRSTHQYFITQGIGPSSMFLTFRTVCNLMGRTFHEPQSKGKGFTKSTLSNCIRSFDYLSVNRLRQHIS